ncbi:DUF721 domain-containing protein [Actinacidiphila acididurans]|uniref:UPF0232 protein ITX44_15550 n=1 Tax=Actinacidiphila acididurans TaxID=2784346 RepID=A0ABS2TSZ2_9ACTN|nr:DciA family protein [Actinacidiphila acididurans]MBM9505942.1 DUF721 domain-containing protein [Actinacidiphila acididurans]
MNRPVNPQGPLPDAGRHLPPTPAPTPTSAPSLPQTAPTGVDLARVALRAAREQARARGAAAVQKKQARRGGLRSGARADGRDPLPLGTAIQRLITERGWETPAAVGGVMGDWAGTVGEDVALHCTPEHYDEQARVLTVRCDSTAWATQVRMLAAAFVRQINKRQGPDTVKMIKVLGPAGPARSYGRLRAPGSRGPGDTYG